MTVRKAMPFLWRYLLVVLSSCMLAFIISSQAHGATDPSSKMNYEKVGQFAFTTQDQQWRDDARGRALPVRIHAPSSLALSGDAAKPNALFPVILFSHGLGGAKEAGKYWGEHWASHGYIVVHIQHPGSDESIWKGKRGEAAVSGMKSAMTMSNLGLRVGDVQFALDEIMAKQHAKSAIFEFADTNKIGMSGHSFGAQTTFLLSGQKSPSVGGQTGFDKRITSAIAFSPNARNKNNLDKQFGDIRMPFMSITGSLDGSILEDKTEPFHRTLPHKHMPAGNKYLIVFDQGDHGVFGGQASGRWRKELPRDDEIRMLTKAASLAFWEATLKSNVQAKNWLNSRSQTQAGFAKMLAVNDVFEIK